MDDDLISKFDDFAKPLFKTIDLLLQKNNLLSEARDILLPRLMTGMIDIDKVKLPKKLLTRIKQENKVA